MKISETIILIFFTNCLVWVIATVIGDHLFNKHGILTKLTMKDRRLFHLGKSSQKLLNKLDNLNDKKLLKKLELLKNIRIISYIIFGVLISLIILF